MKIIIAGGGKVGATLVAELTYEGHDITLIDEPASVMEEIMEQYDIIGVCGNAASMATLEQAGVTEANLLIAVTDADEVNLLTCLTAHAMNPQVHTIARIRNADYREQSYSMRDQYALNMIINPEETAALEIARLLQMPGFQKIETFARGAAEIAELRVKADSPLNGRALNQLHKLVHSPVLVCAVQRGNDCIIPDGNFVMEENDRVYFTASQSALADLLESLGEVSRKARSCLIVGGSRISLYLARELQKSRIPATIIERDHDKCQELASELSETRIVEGDGSYQEFLYKEGIANYDAFVTLTGMDELNIVMSLYASEMHVPAVVTKLSHAENNQILDKLNIGSVISPKDLISASIIRYVRAMQNKTGAAVTMHYIAYGQGEAIEFNVDADTKHQDTPLKDIAIRRNVLIASISRGWHSTLPTGSSTFHEGDTIIVVANSDQKIQNLNDIFEDAE